MEQSTPQSNVPEVHHSSVPQGSLAPEYWNHIDPMYPSRPDPQQFQQQQPQGITWDHPIFTQQQQHQHQNHQQNHVQSQNEHNPDIFSAAPQTWHQNSALTQPQASMSPGSQNYVLPQQHQYHQMPHYPQGQVAYNSHSPAPSSNLPYHSSYSLPSHYYQTPHIPAPEAYSQSPHQTIAPRPGSAQPVQPRPNNGQRSLNYQYILPAEPAGTISHNPVNFQNNYADSNSSVSYQQTIDPQFLTSTQSATLQSQVEPQNEFLFYNPAASTYERPNAAKNYQVYHENVGAMPTVEQFPSQRLPPQQVTQNQSSSLPVLAPQIEVIVPSVRHPEAGGAKTEKMTMPRKKKSSPSKSTEPKIKKARTKTVMKKADDKSASSESDSDSSDESELEVELPPEEPSPLPPTRPDSPEEAAAYDTMKAVWSPRNRRPDVEKIKSALVAYKDVVKSVRDEWKTQSQAMKEAENKSDNDKAAQLKKKVVLQRGLMDVVVTTTLEKGHPLIVEKLGEHPMAVAALYSFLLDRHQASDFDGVLTVNILKLLAQFTTMDEEVLQKTNVMKLLPRIIKKGGQPVKDLAQKILDNAAASTKRKQDHPKAASAKDESPSKDATPESANDASRPDSVAGTKRPREGESNGLPASKRTIAPLTANKTGPSAARPGNGNTVAKRPDGAAEAKPTSSTTTPASTRPKASIIAPKPTSLFGSLTSASKKPGTSNAARAAAAAAAAKEKATTTVEKKEAPPAPPPPKPTLSFGDILADLNKREESSITEPAEDKPPETEEERQKRLRKEARRKLRVSWKPDDSLEEVRLFTHDPEEEIGPNDQLRRDAGDIKGEGRMLKLHKDLDEEDDEEEIGIKEDELRKYEEPSEIDLHDLADDDRTRNFIKRGGIQKPDSPEKEAQERREATTLMVFYTSPGDIPPSPKEPPPPATDEPATEAIKFGPPADYIKAREARYFAVMNPQPTPAPQPTAPPQAAMPTGSVDVASLLKVLQKTPQQQQESTPPPQATPQASLSDLERTFNMFRQQQQAPVQIPQAPPAVSQPIDYQKVLAIFNAQKQMQQMQQMQQQVAFSQVPQSQPVIASNLAALFSQLGGNGAQASQPQSQPPLQAHTQPYEDPERKRLRETGGREGAYDERYNKRPRMYVDPKAKRHPKAGSVPCRYWREGKCLKGEDCTFRHDPLD